MIINIHVGTYNNIIAIYSYLFIHKIIFVHSLPLKHLLCIILHSFMSYVYTRCKGLLLIESVDSSYTKSKHSIYLFAELMYDNLNFY
jgi:hypothetical protein